ncbi:MAG: hypothetical protein M0Z42_18205 [Actinomycetota bacterium]|nr:hypothetical protein [Actinomycetota bacterium]
MCALVVVLHAHRFDETDEGDRVEPEQGVAGDLPLGVLDGQVERRVIWRAPPQAPFDEIAVAGDHRMGTVLP